jgi:hypothetical protein
MEARPQEAKCQEKITWDGREGPTWGEIGPTHTNSNDYFLILECCPNFKYNIIEMCNV